MRKLFLGLILFTSLSSFFNDEPSRPLFWTGEHLTWDHFNNSDEASGNQEAFSYVGITYTYEISNDRPIVYFNAYFDLATSWAMKDKANNQLLVHEQGLFDIAELYARKMRKKMNMYLQTQGQNVKLQPVLDETRKHYQEQVNAMFAAIRKYNVETNNGKNKVAQDRWNTYIKTELSKLEVFRLIANEE
jgi:hypothetical protein